MSRIAFKVLADGQASYHGGSGKWVKGRWRTVTGPLDPCANGLHYCRRDQLILWLGPQIWVFEDGTPGETIDAVHKMVTRKGRIVERLETWNERTARLFAADVAELALVHIPVERREPFAAAVAAARGFARGEIGRDELGAAYADAYAAAHAAHAAHAAYAAARSAGADAAYAAAAAYDGGAGGDVQTTILFEYLEGVRGEASS